MTRTVWVGASYVCSAVGEGVHAAYTRMRSGGTALVPHADLFGAPAIIGSLPGELAPANKERLQQLLDRALDSVLTNAVSRPLDARWGCFIATTKGDIATLERGDTAGSRLPLLAEHVQQRYRFASRPYIVSNACASGTTAIALAASAIRMGRIDHAVVVGIEMLSRFVLNGFRSLHALSPTSCRPFDAGRDGTALGEACAALLLTKETHLLTHSEGQVLGGGVAHDANHISGPSRTGEGLIRAIAMAMHQAGLGAHDVHAINAHGTATDYNDAMESIAFERCGLGQVPLSSYKGWFGHTLGAAGVLETAIALHALRQGTVLRTEGLHEPAFPARIDALTEDRNVGGDVLLKTSSGFGGCNAALVLRALS